MSLFKILAIRGIRHNSNGTYLSHISERGIKLALSERFSTVKVCASGNHGPLCTGTKGIDLYSRVFNANAYEFALLRLLCRLPRM